MNTQFIVFGVLKLRTCKWCVKELWLMHCILYVCMYFSCCFSISFVFFATFIISVMHRFSFLKLCTFYLVPVLKILWSCQCYSIYTLNPWCETHHDACFALLDKCTIGVCTLGGSHSIHIFNNHAIHRATSHTFRLSMPNYIAYIAY